MKCGYTAKTVYHIENAMMLMGIVTTKHQILGHPSLKQLTFYGNISGIIDDKVIHLTDSWELPIMTTLVISTQIWNIT